MGIITPDVNLHTGLLVDDGSYSPKGAHTQQTVSNTAIVEDDLDTPRPEEATGILIQTLDDNLLFTIDGSDPTDVGFVLFKEQLPLYVPLNHKNTLTVIRETNDSDVRYQWVRKEN